MSTLYSIQQEIVNKLTNNISDLKIEKHNIIFNDFLSPNVKGKVAVEFLSGRFSEPEAKTGFEQTVTLNWKIILVLRNFPEITEDTYNYIEKVLESLSGIKVIGCDTFYCSGIELKKTIDDKYYYELIFINKTKYII